MGTKSKSKAKRLALLKKRGYNPPLEVDDFPLYEESILRAPCLPVLNAEHAKQLYAQLEEKFPSRGALGLACPQIGIHVRASLIKLPGSTDYKLICNPEILSQENEFLMTGEGCLSFPKDFRNTVRYRNVKVKYWDENFEERTVVAEGMEAVVFQHEIDHLNGIIYKDRVTKPYRAEPVQGRNEKCACGSGKKFKKCHGV